MSDAQRLELSESLVSENGALREELRKLRRINAALMDRVERSSDMSANAFSMFETAISLEAMVRERTSQLEDALGKLAKANSDSEAAHQSADAARLRLRDAIESINEGFVLFDADDRLVLFNEAYLGFWPELSPHMRVGMEFSEIAQLAAKHERPLGAVVAPDRWVSERLARHGVADGGHVQALSDGRWVQINELRTSEGGIVGIYTDITEVKAEDARARALELAERNLILQSTLDTLSEGVCMFDSAGRLSAWNGALGHLLGLGEDPRARWPAMAICSTGAARGWAWRTMAASTGRMRAMSDRSASSARRASGVSKFARPAPGRAGWCSASPMSPIC
jgi:PAS domain-containing protein